MRSIPLFIILILVCSIVNGQTRATIKGRLTTVTGKPIAGATIVLENSMYKTTSDDKGAFLLQLSTTGEYVLSISKIDFNPKRFPIVSGDTVLNLGTLVLEPNITVEKTDNLIALTDNDLSGDDKTLSNAVGLLQATKDIFLRRAAFDFGQAFFRVRGLDSRNGQVMLNGLVMNKLFNGRPEWNNWGGLNDVIRNQTFSNGMEASSFTFGGVLGNTNIDLRPSGLRSGTRISSSFSNRTYTGRIMATHTSPVSNTGISYTLSASRRLANQGYIQGTLYNSFSLFGSVDYAINTKHRLGLTAIVAKNRRGRSSAITDEVFRLVGKRYNPYWGAQEGRIRNARERAIFEPIILFNHYYTSKNVSLSSGIAYQFGKNERSRIRFFNAPNPDPTFFRYLPSFYINNPIGADFTNAALAREGFLIQPQINWGNLFRANQNNGTAAYVLAKDVIEDNSLQFGSTANIRLNGSMDLDMGVNYSILNSNNYATLFDLLGASFHEDIDPFSNTQNDINGDLVKQEGQRFGYHYTIKGTNSTTFAQLKYHYKKWSAFLATQWQNTRYQRNGLFQNQRFINDSFGKSVELNFSNIAIKGGLGYQPNGRHWLKVNTALLGRAPLLQNSFINPRENNGIVPMLANEKITFVDVSYFIRLPKLSGRLSGFYGRFQNTTDVNFFFVDSGVGSDFVQEVLTGLDRLNKGLEIGLEYSVSPEVKINAVANFGSHSFASNPNVTINFDTAGAEENLINTEGNIDLGTANIKGLKLAQGPQRALALGIEYRDPKYWWIGATANHLANNYANISTITRTQSFFINPETGDRFPNASPENVTPLLQQSKLGDFYLLNIIGGKSWLKSGKYISLFISINNAFDTVFKSGGFEQSRNGNFGQLRQDSLRDNPSFAPKFWYGFGRTYFVNFAISF